MRWWSGVTRRKGERLGRDGPGRRLSGPPRSANGASSLHLWWVPTAPEPFREVSAVLCVEQLPAVPRLYFWALQVSFLDHGRCLGAGHTGLQWNPGAPAGAVNWGGYGEPGQGRGGAGPGGGVLEGTGSVLPPVDGPHTRHFAWQAGVPYRFRVWSARPGAWRSEVTDLVTGETTLIRDLLVPASGLGSPVVWSEVFARCDDPPARARWSSLEVVVLTGEVVTVREVRPTYQGYAEGGCSNSESRADGDGFVQVTGLSKARGRQPDLLTLGR